MKAYVTVTDCAVCEQENDETNEQFHKRVATKVSEGAYKVRHKFGYPDNVEVEYED